MKKVTPKLPALWRRNAIQPSAEYFGPPPDPELRDRELAQLEQMVPGIRKASTSGWEIVAYISATTQTPNGWGSGRATFLLSLFSNGMLLRCIDYRSLDDAMHDAEIFARCIPGLFIVVGEAEQPVAEFGLTSAADLLDHDPPVREWHVPGLVPAGLPTLLSGDGATGKSLLSLQLAVATAAGRSWLGLPVCPGPAIFMSAEDDQDEVHRRLADIAAREGLSRRELVDLSINARVGEDALLGILNPDTRMIEPTALFGALERAVQRTRPALIVLDTLADLFGGDENVRGQARQFVGLLRPLSSHCGSSIVCLAHPSVAGMASGTGTSGSTGWGNSVRSRLYLERDFQMRGKGEGRQSVEPDRAVRILTTKKLNGGEQGGVIRLRYRDGVLARDEVTLLAGPTSSKAAHADEQIEEKFLELLAAHRAEGRNVSDAGPTYAPTKFEKDARADGIKRGAFAKAMGRLFAQRRITMVEFGPDSKVRKRIEEVRE